MENAMTKDLTVSTKKKILSLKQTYFSEYNEMPI